MDGSSYVNNFPDLNIYDLACRIKFGFPRIDVENLSFSLKDIPFRVKGNIFFSRPPLLNLKFSSFPNQPPEVRVNNPERFDMVVKGTSQEDKFNGEIGLDFVRKTKTRSSLVELKTIFENLTFFISHNKGVNISFESATLSYKLGNNLYNIILKDFITLFYPEDKIIRFSKFDCKFYDGFVEGKGVIDITQVPFKSSFDINISDVGVNKLRSLLTYCSKIHGNLSSQILYRSFPSSRLFGKLLINDGLLDNMQFFKWVADFLRIRSLKRITFDTLSAEFEVNEEGSHLEQILLESKEVNFNGYFTLYENDFVSSELSLLLSKGLLNESSKLRRLTAYLDKDTPSLSFNFRLSGLFQSMNFKWLASDFKQILQDLLPYRIERKLETDIEKIVESISKK